MEVKLQHCLQYSNKITAPHLNKRRIGNNKNLIENIWYEVTPRDVCSILSVWRVMTSSVLKAKTAARKLSVVICSAPEVKGFLP